MFSEKVCIFFLKAYIFFVRPLLVHRTCSYQLSESTNEENWALTNSLIARPKFHVTLVFMVLQPNKTVLHKPYPC